MPLLLLTGEWDELHDLAVTTRAQGSPLEQPMASMIFGHLQRSRGNLESAWEMVREILPRGPASEPEDALFPYATEALRLATWLSIDASDPERARAWLKTHDYWIEWSGAVRGKAESATLLSEILRLEEKLESAESTAAEAVAIASEPRQPLAMISARRTLGSILLQHGNLPVAEAHLTHALQLARESQLPYETALTEAVLARLHRERHEDDRAMELLGSARGWAETLRAAPLLKQIEELSAAPLKQNGFGVLTERELEVLRMIAQGLTDAEAAEKLYISPRTVSQHMRSVYNKLGVSSRAAATRWAVQNKVL